MLKILFFILVFICVLRADEYPKTFSQLGTPLYKSAEQLSSFSDENTLNTSIIDFANKAEKVKNYGLNVDKKSDEKLKKEYLFELRKLQKSYDYTLHLLHQELNKSIDKNDYKKFVFLCSYELDGFLQNGNIKKRAFEYYQKNKAQKTCKTLEKKLKNETLLQETTQEFYNEIVQSTYSSNQGDRTPRKSVYIIIKRELNKIYVSFENTNLYDVTVSVKGNYVNIYQSENTQNEFVIKAKSKQQYTTLSVGEGKSFYSYSYSWIIGNKDAVHDDTYLYRFPYEKNTAHKISQGYNGAYTHKGSSKFALDFVMDEGTKVCAAREGRVIRTKSDSNSGGYDEKFAKDGNYVTIAHKDGTLATYYHLKRGGVAVNVGENVQRGRVIGYSGNTGYSSGPHLHFAVFTAINSHATETIAVKFISKDEVVNVPIQGEIYTAK